MSRTIKITFLGTGTSQGIPVIACDCEVCRSTDPRDKRLRASLMLETGENVFVIDTGPDFRQQMLRHHVQNLSAVLFTHEHKDHVAGLDDVRSFNFKLGRSIDIYAEKRVQRALKREYAYIFARYKYPGVPDIKMNLLKNETFAINGTQFIPIRALHQRLPVFGFRTGGFAYLTDVKSVPEEEISKLDDLDIMVITALRKEKHISHMCLDEALSFIEKIGPGKAYLTHLSHRFGLHEKEEKNLPENVFIAYDSLQLSLP